MNAPFSMLKRILARLGGWGLATLAVATPLAAADAPPPLAPFKEYEVKAACLFNFGQFVEWPAAAFAATNSPLGIGVLGADPFGEYLNQIVQNETIKGRKVTIQSSRRVEDLLSCHVLFISKSEKGRLPQILAALGNTSVLTVGEVEGFAERGVMINFYLQGNKVRFEINPTAAQRQGLKISSQLLKLGKIVGPAFPPPKD